MRELINKEEIKQLFEKKIKPRVRALEVARTSSLQWMGIFASVIIAAACTMYMMWGLSIREDSGKGLVFISAVITLLGAKFIFSFFVAKFKKEVISEVFKALMPGSHYDSAGCVASHHFSDSHLITSDFDELKGEDYVRGQLGSMALEFSEINVLRVSRDSKGRKSKSTLYAGLFFSFNLPKNLEQNTLILADYAEKSLGRNVGRFIQKNSMRSGYELVQLESVQFEKEFVVYSNDQIKSRLMLKPLILENLTLFKKKYKEEIDVSIRGNMLYIGIRTTKNHFEPQMFGEVVKFKDIREIYDLMILVKELQEGLDLDVAA